MFKLNKKFAAGLSVAIALTAISTSASANVPPYGQRYARTFTDGTFVATATYDGKSVAVSETMTRPLNSTGPLGSLSSAAFNYYMNLQSDLNAMVVQQGAINGFSTQGGLLSGPLSLAISSGAAPGYPAGTLKVTLSGLSYGFTASGSVKKAGITVTCDDNITFNGITMAFYYNPMSGAVIGADRPQLNPTQNVQCSSILDIIPIVGNLADRYAESMTSKMVSNYLNQWGTQVASGVPGVRFFGIENYIRPNQYMISGFDAGAYITNNLGSILQTSGTVSMTVGGQITDINYQDTGSDAYLAFNVFKLSFTNASHSFAFTLDERAHYNEKLICLGNRANCPNLP